MIRRAGIVVALACCVVGTAYWLHVPDRARVTVPENTAPQTDRVRPHREIAAAPVHVKFSRENQKEIWQAEHVTLEIETRHGARLKQAIRVGDRDAFTALLSDDLMGAGFRADAENSPPRTSRSTVEPLAMLIPEVGSSTEMYSSDQATL